jgi:thioredoxin reductase (NADPH)
MSEQLIIWAIGILLVVIVFVPYYRKFRKSQKLFAERRQEARELGIDRPQGQFPMINRSLCIGCGACVDACPEGDVLGVVWGTAEVINGKRCVGHAKCEVVCPVGALKVGLGDVRSRPDIPILSPENETSVPGIFIAGELSGLSLIRHAVAQGTRVATEISKRIRPNQNNGEVFDILIVGAGPAGISAALVAKQNELNCIVLDQNNVGGTILHYPRRKMVMTQPVEIPMYGPLDKEEYSKEDLLSMWNELSTAFNLNIIPGQKLEKIAKQHDIFVVETTDGSRFPAKNIVLALGRRGTPRKLGVPGEESTKVLYSLMDAQSYQNQHLLIVGGGDSAIEAAAGLARQNGNTVSISYRKNKFFRIKKKNEDKITKLISSKKVIPYFDSQVQQILPKSVILEQNDKQFEIPNDVVIIQAGGIPPYDMLKEIGITFGGDSIGLAEADKEMAVTVT